MGALLLGALKLALTVQASQAAIAGTVRDGESGAPLAGAVVVLTDLDRAVFTDASGRYRLEGVPAGPQHLSVKRIGFSPRSVHALVPGEGDLSLDFSLRPVPLQLPAIVVRSPVAVRGLDPADSTPFPDRGISAAALRNHPLLAEPDGFLALSGGEVSAAPEAPSGMHIRGGASDQVAYLLDGIPVFSPYHTAGTFSAWNPDALDRLQVLSALPQLDPPDALSGAIAGATRATGAEVRAQGTFSTSHGRLTMLGPVGGTGAGFLLSVRSGFPGLFAPERDPSYLRGHTGDVLGKLEGPAFGGRLRVLAYDNHNSVDATTLSPDSVRRRPRNGFEWSSRSVGLEWSRRVEAAATLRIRAWNAMGEAEAGWHPDSGLSLALESDREDQGLLLALERQAGGRYWGAGLRIQRSRTAYRVAAHGGSGVGTSLRAMTPSAALFFQHRRPLVAALSADLALSTTAAARDVWLGAQGELRWRPSAMASLSAGYARSHQFSQSLRNSESVAGGIFPADLFIGAGSREVPVGRSDRAVLAAEWLAFPGVRLGGQLHAGEFEGLVLVAPRASSPFANGAFVTGSGSARGLSLDAAMSGSRFGVTASYGWQRVRLAYGDSSFAPGYGASHLVEAGLVVFPASTMSIRLGLAGALGRRGSGLLGAFEWESCNLLDQGCEFVGSPGHDTGSLGRVRLPSYLRLDAGVRQHWHLELAGRDVELAIFGTVTNLLGRRNVLALATDPVTGKKTAIEMRPLAPLVVGVDWKF